MKYTLVSHGKIQMFLFNVVTLGVVTQCFPCLVGHGFKMAPVVGKILSQLALGELPEYDITNFRISRFQNVGPKASL